MELDLHRLELRFAATRISDALAVQRLANSIEANGQLVECVAVGQPGDSGLVLIDGYRRVAALRRLRRDTAQVQCWSCPVGQALAQVLARAGSRAFMPIEEALLLRQPLAPALPIPPRPAGMRQAPRRAALIALAIGVQRLAARLATAFTAAVAPPSIAADAHQDFALAACTGKHSTPQRLICRDDSRHRRPRSGPSACSAAVPHLPGPSPGAVQYLSLIHI